MSIFAGSARRAGMPSWREGLSSWREGCGANLRRLKQCVVNELAYVAKRQTYKEYQGPKGRAMRRRWLTLPIR
jgi:hypothetical protein